MGLLSVLMVQMKQSQFAPLHAQLKCLLVPMAFNVFPRQSFVMGLSWVDVMTNQTTSHLCVTTAPLTIYLPALIGHDASKRVKSVMELLIVRMDLTKACRPVPSYQSAQMISLHVLMERNVFLNITIVMDLMIARMVQMNLSHSALLHVQLICLPALMA